MTDITNERIDLTQFEKNERNDEYKIEACIGDYTRYMYEDENDIALSKQLNMLPALIDELKRMYEREDADFAGMKYELLVDETGNGLEEAEIVATYPTFEEAKNASQKLHSQTWIVETRFVDDTDEVIESTIIYGAESFGARTRGGEEA